MDSNLFKSALAEGKEFSPTSLPCVFLCEPIRVKEPNERTQIEKDILAQQDKNSYGNQKAKQVLRRHCESVTANRVAVEHLEELSSTFNPILRDRS